MPEFRPSPEQLAVPLLALMEASQQGFALFDRHDRLRYANPLFRRVMALEPDEFPTWLEAMRLGYARRRGVKVDAGDFETWLASALGRRGKAPYRLLEVDTVDGRWTLIGETTLLDGGMLCVLTDVTELNTGRRELRQQRDVARRAALTDALTGLSNRRHLGESLHALLAAGHGLALALLNLDRFKQINDLHGHEGGDAVLRHFARLLQKHAQRDGLAGRLGGEEFVLVLRVASRHAAAACVRALLDELARTPPPGLPALRCTASAGLVFAEPGDTPDALLARADALMYAAKRDGRQHCVVETEAGGGLRATQFNGL